MDIEVLKIKLKELESNLENETVKYVLNENKVESNMQQPYLWFAVV